MKKWMKYIIIGMIVVTSCFGYAHIDKAQNVYDVKTDNNSYVSVNIGEDLFVSQSFRCSENSIDGISLKILVNGTSKAGELCYQLQDENGKELISGKYPLNKIKSERINKIKFNKSIENCKNNSYVIILEVVGLEENESLGIYYDPVGERNGSFYVNGEKTDGTLILRWITHRFDTETFVVTLGFVVYFIVFFKILYKLFS